MNTTSEAVANFERGESAAASVKARLARIPDVSVRKELEADLIDLQSTMMKAREGLIKALTAFSDNR